MSERKHRAALNRAFSMCRTSPTTGIEPQGRVPSAGMTEPETDGGRISIRTDALLGWIILGIEYVIVSSLLLVSGVVLVRTVVSFLRYGNNFSNAVVGAIDGILVVIIILDIAHTVFGHLRSSVFPVRPFLIIGILAGVRDILSSSAHLTLSVHLTQREFYNTLISLGVGVGVVIFLLLGLLILRFSGPLNVDDEGIEAHAS
jgi:hypothetical protein